MSQPARALIGRQLFAIFDEIFLTAAPPMIPYDAVSGEAQRCLSCVHLTATHLRISLMQGFV
jgi:hypothetical protein